MTNLSESILKTIIYYDFFNYPLTLIEIHKYLILDANRANLSEIGECIANLDKIECSQGFYFLRGRESIIETRKLRYRLSLTKLKKAKIVIRFLTFVPWVKAVFIGSSLGYLNAKDTSDIDLLIITTENRIWSARFFSAGFLKLLNLRPKPNKTKDKFCLSYFITENNLNLENTKVNNDDIHLKYLLLNYLPIYSENGLWEKFIEENKWLKNNLANHYSNVLVENYVLKLRWLKLKKFFRFIHRNYAENILRFIQIKIMPQLLKEMANKDKRVIINDNILKLHSNDKREDISNKWLQQCQKIIS
ncbi:hypothetical protein HOE31_01795 [bacterium]|jgi:hypothetical protein|nr:hypothetical protein [bacterium]MBT4121663.1 hypothetical protein [bacterium]MBT4335234.1 hypothetical protein [bacterium]MBT4495666.1 hypothetical protein [bacterium]MBT4763812.1 hypothetical protein [bacterium]